MQKPRHFDYPNTWRFSNLKVNDVKIRFERNNFYNMRERGLFQVKLPLERRMTEDKAISNAINDITQVSDTWNVQKKVLARHHLTTSNIWCTQPTWKILLNLKTTMTDQNETFRFYRMWIFLFIAVYQQQ